MVTVLRTSATVDESFGTSTLKVNVVDLYSASTRNVSKALRYSTHNVKG